MMIACGMVMTGKGMTNQNGIGLIGIEFAISFNHQFKTWEDATAFKL
ncbi:Uncharacterised protein [Mycobacteroides abscessus]|jgi:hypothetical protein|nr:Uncharacterised protein [Mycobacteroides abscessus]